MKDELIKILSKYGMTGIDGAMEEEADVVLSLIKLKLIEARPKEKKNNQSFTIGQDGFIKGYNQALKDYQEAINKLIKIKDYNKNDEISFVSPSENPKWIENTENSIYLAAKIGKKESIIAIPKEMAMELSLARDYQKLGLLTAELINKLFETTLTKNI